MLDINQSIPNFQDLTDKIKPITGWEIIPVTGLIPDRLFFEYLADKKFPATVWIRPISKLNYIQEPDLFHDIFGHIPLLINPFFANFMQSYGKEALKLNEDQIKHIARLYWYTTEFGLIKNSDLKIYGSGIVSSKEESIYSIHSNIPNRIKFDINRIMSTKYIISSVQKTYFVINSYTDLEKIFTNDFNNIISHINDEYESDVVIPNDIMI